MFYTFVKYELGTWCLLTTRSDPHPGLDYGHRYTRVQKMTMAGDPHLSLEVSNPIRNSLRRCLPCQCDDRKLATRRRHLILSQLSKRKIQFRPFCPRDRRTTRSANDTPGTAPRTGPLPLSRPVEETIYCACVVRQQTGKLLRQLKRPLQSC